MASDEHKALAQFLKDVHSSLRKASSKVGTQQAWQDHCADKEVLKMYAHSMEKLATNHWTQNSSNETTRSRIEWAAMVCKDYFIDEGYLKCRDKEKNICSKINIEFNDEQNFSQPIKLIDVGSCYNPFKVFEFLDVLAIDLYPANSSVLQCDFLKVSVGLSTDIVDSSLVEQLQQCSFDVVTFCFLLEYLPSSGLRIKACKKAYIILKPGGLLLINTPDSKHVGANSKIMKCWQYTLANMGFIRIKYEKMKHMHCMAFRKALHKETAERWARIHKEPYMKYAIHIPQDLQKKESQDFCEDETQHSHHHSSNNNAKLTKTEIITKNFQQLPFFTSALEM